VVGGNGRISFPAKGRRQKLSAKQLKQQIINLMEQNCWLLTPSGKAKSYAYKWNKTEIWLRDIMSLK